MREKLIELLREVQYLGGLEEKIADHLIANGVVIAKMETTTKWIPVTERLPKDDRFLVTTSNGVVGEAFLDEGKFYWQECVGNEYWDGEDPIESVTHWMPLPEPPKGE